MRKEFPPISGSAPGFHSGLFSSPPHRLMNWRILVTVYSKNNCQPCRLTKMALDRKGVPYNERRVDLDADALAEIKALGYLQVPVVVTPDGDSWSGLRPDKISTL